MDHIYGKMRTIGRATVADADLLFVWPESLTITLMVTPNNFPDRMSSLPSGRPEQHFWITLVARGLESESNVVRLRIDWDGLWEIGDAGMRLHFRIAND
jgi:hypothetical protein